eukprot:scaffold3823_cov195-Amphora_coffeaeformis.AAC.15
MTNGACPSHNNLKKEDFVVVVVVVTRHPRQSPNHSNAQRDDRRLVLLRLENQPTINVRVCADGSASIQHRVARCCCCGQYYYYINCGQEEDC